MESFKKDKSRLFEIIKSIEKAEATLVGIKYEDFLKENERRGGIVTQLRNIVGLAKQLSREFQVAYRNIDWNFLMHLLDGQNSPGGSQPDPGCLWYLVENDLPIIKDQVFEITAVITDKGDDVFYI